MADVTDLRCWPSCLDAIDWSPDGIIALASDERVELLFPNTVTFDRDQDDAQWQHVPLQVPWFTTEELSVKEPAPLNYYSIGEEISASAPISIAWSPPGLSKHRRCALAALTANLVLSIWSSAGKPKEGSSWARRLIVNDALKQYFSNNVTHESHETSCCSLERMRLRIRIRAFAWATAIPGFHSSNALGTRLLYGQHMVAVCNDDNQVAIIAIKSPASAYDLQQRSWIAEVLTHVSITPGPDTAMPPSFFDDMMEQQRYISNISWGPWTIVDDAYRSLIAYTTNNGVRARTVTCKHDLIDLGDEVVYPNTDLRFGGLMKWLHTVDSGVCTLALFSSIGLVCLQISLNDASIVAQLTHNLDGRWDQVSGVAWDFVHRDIPNLHFSSLLSTTRNVTAAFEVSSDQLKPIDAPSWRDQIENSAVLFSARNDLKGHSKVKVWGLAPSPLGDFLATCHSVHPLDMIEYGSPNDRRGTVAISALQQYRQIRQDFPSSDVSAESVLFTIKKLVEHTVEESERLPAFSMEIVEKLSRTYGIIESPTIGTSTLHLGPDSSELGSSIQRLKRAAWFHPETLKDRYTVLVSMACDVITTQDLEKTLIAYRLARAVEDCPAALSTTSFSVEIRAHHRKVVSLVQALILLRDGQANAEQLHETQAEPLSSASDAASPMLLNCASTTISSTTLGPSVHTVDMCDFCSAPIPFIDLATAECSNGHQFPRCGLSFLPIQAPGISKYCGICRTPFLSEEFVFAQDAMPSTVELSDRGDGGDYYDSLHGEKRQQSFQTEPGSRINNTYKSSDIIIGDRESKSRGGQDHRNEGEDHTNEDRTNRSPANEDEGRTPITLSSVLFLACDACIYCGGKFID